MRKRIIGLSCAVFVIAVILSVATDGGASRYKYKSRFEAEPFAMSIEYTGRIGGDMRIDGVNYRLAKNAPVHVIGEGPLTRKTTVVRQRVYVTGEKLGRDGIIHSVIVRPPEREREVNPRPRLLPANLPD